LHRLFFICIVIDLDIFKTSVSVLIILSNLINLVSEFELAFEHLNMGLRPRQPLLKISLFSIFVFLLTRIHNLHIVIIVVRLLLVLRLLLFLVHLLIVSLRLSRFLHLFVLSTLIDGLVLGE